MGMQGCQQLSDPPSQRPHTWYADVIGSHRITFFLTLTLSLCNNQPEVLGLETILSLRHSTNGKLGNGFATAICKWRNSR